MTEDTIRAGDATLAAWVIAALVNAVVLAFGLPPDATVGDRLVLHAFDLGQFLAVGLMGRAAVHLWQRARPESKLADAAAVAAAALAIGVLTLRVDVEAMARRLSEELPMEPVLWGSLVVAAAGIAVAWLVGRLAARPRLRWAAGAVGVIVLGVHPRLLPRDYEGVHLFATLAATTLMAAALTGEPAKRKLPWPRVAMAVACLVAAASLVIAPPWRVVQLALENSGSVLPPYLGRVRAGLEDPPVAAEPAMQQNPFFRDRGEAPPVPPTGAALSDGTIVIFVGIDAVRADVIASRKHDTQLPTLAKLRDQSLYFENARAPGTLTKVTYAAVFMGTYFSHQYWVRHSDKNKSLTPSHDATPRFPQVLQEHGVRTVTFAAAPWLLNDIGVVRGFDEEAIVPKTTKSYYTTAGPVMDKVLERLARVDDKPLFLFVHFLDPHAPYDLGGTDGSSFDRYIAEVATVDQQLARLVAALDAPALAKRTMLVVTADHGEAFGEHNSKTHGTTVYDEVMRVPLLLRIPGVEPRKVQEPVSLIDIGPTVLDAFGLPTPGHFMGQSLLPLVRRQDARFERPIIAESRLKKAMVLPDGMKIIVDDYEHTTELYDLVADPGELHNLADDKARLADPLAKLRELFAVHTLVREGYEVPYLK